jgi:integrase
LHKALKAAVADGLIPCNAAAGLKVPRITREEIRPLTGEESRRLLEAVRGKRLEALCVLALSTGMRQGELLALKWEDVELEGGRLRVRRTLTHAYNAFVLGEPKTNNSRRTIRLTKGTVTALQDHLSRQLGEIENMGSLYQPGGLIFATEAGTIINPSNIRNRSLKPLLRQASRRSASTTSGTPAPRYCSRKTSTPKSSPSISETLASSSPWISTRTCSRTCRRRLSRP